MNKREEFAILILQMLLQIEGMNFEEAIIHSVSLTDALIKKLEETA